PVLTRSFQQASSAFNIVTNERRRIQNRTIDMRFGGEVHDSIESMFRKNAGNLTGIRDVSANKFVAGILRNFIKVSEITCVREQVVVHDFDIFASLKDESHEAGADETCSTSDKNLHI